MSVGNLLTCRKHSNDFIISLRKENWVHKDTFTSLLLLKGMQQARKVSGHVSGIDFASTVCQLDFITVPTAGYFRVFFFIL